MREVTYTLKNTSKPLECQLITSIDLSTCYERIRAMLALEREKGQGVVSCVWFLRETQCNLGKAAPWSLSDSPASLQPSGCWEETSPSSRERKKAPKVPKSRTTQEREMLIMRERKAP